MAKSGTVIGSDGPSGPLLLEAVTAESHVTWALRDGSAEVAPERQTLVIVGNGMTSWRLCHELVDVGATAELDVIVVGQESLPAYDRIRLTTLLGGSRVQDLLLAGEDWYASVGIELLLGETVVQIDRQECSIGTDRGREIFYDRLILATGSTPFVPPIAGAGRRGVFVYRTVDDLQAVRAYSSGRQRAVVVGGGLLGLEAAKAVVDLGLKVDVVEAAPRLMVRQLDAEGAVRLREQIEALGVRVHLGAPPTAIDDAGGDRLSVRLPSGRALPGDLVILSAGVRPSAGLARAAGLDMAPNGGVSVDDRMQTSDDRIFAIGECAAHEGTSYGLIAPGYQMARVIVGNLIGARTVFERPRPVAKLKLLGIEVSSVGEFQDTDSAVALRHQTANGYRKIVLRDGQIVGAVAVGAWTGFDEAAQAVQEGTRPSPAELRRFGRKGELRGERKRGRVTDWPADAVVCTCNRVTRGQIEAACGRGCADVAAVGKATTAGTICGSCKPLVEELVQLAPAASIIPLGAALRARRTLRGLQLFADSPALARGTPPHGLRPNGMPPPRRETLSAFRAVRGSRPVVPVRPAIRERGLRILISLAAAAVLVVGVAAFAPAQAAPGRLLKLWTGYTTLGLAGASLLLSLRKRWSRFAVLDVPLWRAIHGCLGLGALVSVCIHTGLHLGSGLNRALVVDFLAAVVLGSVASVVFAAGPRLSPAESRDRRRRFSELHVAILWPLPILLGLHILAAYFYG